MTTAALQSQGPSQQYSFPQTKSQPPNGLSVISAPAPVVQRPELFSTNSAGSSRTVTQQHQQQQLAPPIENISGLRSTKSQRIRGASNNMRIKQIEMREQNAVVFS